MDTSGIQNTVQKVQFWGATAAALAILISLVHITRHLRYNTSKEIKQCTLRILLLVPFYSLDCFLSLVLNNSGSAWPYLLTAFREFYEAVVLTAFMQLVLTFLGRRKDGSMGGPIAVGDSFCTAMRKPSHTSINSRLGFIPALYSPGASFISGVCLGILQYAVVMVVVLAADIIIWWQFGEKVNSLCTGGGLCVWKIPFYMKACSCGFAMYNLMFFYFEAKMCTELKERLDLIHPHNKFFSVKMIIFFTFFQKLFVGTILNDWFHFFDRFAGGDNHWTATSMAEGFQTFLLCLEMLLFAVWHMQAYPVDEFNKLDAATSLQAAINKRSRVELESAVQEAVNAGLAAEPDPTDKLAKEWHAKLREARALLEQLYPEVRFQGVSSAFVLRTSQAATVHIKVDAHDRRLQVTSFEAGGIEDGDMQVTLVPVDNGEETLHRRSTAVLAQEKKVATVQEDLAGFVHTICSPSGEVGFLRTCAMYKDILALRKQAQNQRRAVQLVRGRAGKMHLTEDDIKRAFGAFDRKGTQTISRLDFLHVFVGSSPHGDEAEASQLLDSMGVGETAEFSYDTFKSFLSSMGTNPPRRGSFVSATTSTKNEFTEPLLEGGGAA